MPSAGHRPHVSVTHRCAIPDAPPTTVGLAVRDACRVARHLGRHGGESATPTRSVSEDCLIHDDRGLTVGIQKTLTEFFARLFFCGFATSRERSPFPALREILPATGSCERTMP